MTDNYFRRTFINIERKKFTSLSQFDNSNTLIKIAENCINKISYCDCQEDYFF